MADVKRIPLFPLNTVLFPGVPISLHVFEPRYQKMIRYCLSENKAFGVVLIQKGVEALGPLAMPYSTGCSAAIVETEPLGDGRLSISAVGMDRFQIQSLDYDQAYLIGDVVNYPLMGTKNPAVSALANNLRPWIEKYIRLIAENMLDQINLEYLPVEPMSLAYIAAYLLQAPINEKQSLLELETLGEMLQTLEKLYKRETALIRRLIKNEGPIESGFGLN